MSRDPDPEEARKIMQMSPDEQRAYTIEHGYRTAEQMDKADELFNRYYPVAEAVVAAWIAKDADAVAEGVGELLDGGEDALRAACWTWAVEPTRWHGTAKGSGIITVVDKRTGKQINPDDVETDTARAQVAAARFIAAANSGDMATSSALFDMIGDTEDGHTQHGFLSAVIGFAATVRLRETARRS